MSDSIATEESKIPNAFFIMHKTNWIDQSICYTNNPETVATFMLGKQLDQYILHVNGREYDFGKNPAWHELVERLIYLLEMDDNFYPPEKFPREHWWK